MRQPRLYSYIVATDDGFAPNPFHCVCTLACCKPKIRTLNGAQVGDYVVGLGTQDEHWRIIYAMKVTDKLTFDQYWRDSRFQAKRPNMLAGGIESVGDNIYRWDSKGNEYRQARSLHSKSDGTENVQQKRHDTKGDDHWVLISDNYIYWGSQSPDAPPFHRDIIKRGPGHRCHFSPEVVDAFIKWFNTREKRGLVGMPTNELPSPTVGRPAREKC